MSVHNGMNFTTKDQDNDVHSSNCAVSYKESGGMVAAITPM